jgi:acetylornithine deacetylase/succinyl-diaminopimelate desuccinylase-like protein
MDDATIAKESSDLLAHLIRNACVNDGTDDSGFESRSTDVLAQYLGDSGLDLERYSARPGRENLVARIEGDRASTRPSPMAWPRSAPIGSRAGS